MGSRLGQLDPRKPSVAITVALGTFHTVLLVLIGVALVYFFGDPGDGLDGLNTFAGLGLFAYLWVITWVTAAGALRAVEWPRVAGPSDILNMAALWGGFTGAAVLVVASLAASLGFLVYGVATLQPDVALASVIFLPFASIGGLVAFVVGMVFGLWFGLVDALLFAAAIPAYRRGSVRAL